MTLLLMLVGLGGLWLGTRWTLDGALAIASRYGLSHSFVGIGILAVATDLPELFVTLRGSLLLLEGIDSSGIVAGNALGSCMSNLTLILGVAAILVPVRLQWFEFKRDGAALLLSLVILFFFSMDGRVNRLEGGFLLLFYLGYFLWFARSALRTSTSDVEKGREPKNSLRKPFLLTLAGLLVLSGSGQLVVMSAIVLASNLGLEQSAIGATIVGLGTSLPESSVTVGAALRGKNELAFGNIIGSNIFNSLVLFGLSGVLAPMEVDRTLLYLDFPMLFFVTMAVLLQVWNKRRIGKTGGALLVMSYLIYVTASYVAAAP